MDQSRWERVARVFDSAVKREAHERTEYVARACADDRELRSELEALLAEHDRSALIDAPIGETAQELLGDNRAVLTGQQIGAFRLGELLGVGGMGEVYRAHDTKLARDVAIKILPAAFAADADRVARFKREAQVLASLNHPHIAGIYGLEESDGSRALVLELVEGPTLADRLARGPLPIDEALAIARQIAEALEAAHEQGIIHRDLKPANIKVRDDGTVKVLDFGLAKLIAPVEGGYDVAVGPAKAAAGPAKAAAGPAKAGQYVQHGGVAGVGPHGGVTGPNLSASPTITTPAMTAAGIILGTAAYMSPEQAKGKPADKRSDIWAFGCVLYEMLTGKRAFDGEDVSDTLAAILRGEPDWTAIPTDTPGSIRRLLRRCLAKDRRARLSDASSARLEIEDALSSADRDDRTPRHVPRVRDRIVWSVGAALITFLIAATFGWILRPQIATSEIRVEVTTPATSNPLANSFAISPDGRQIVFVAMLEGVSRLWVRSFATGAARPLTGTDEANLPFWSPDSRAVAFFAGGKLKRVEINSGSVVPLTNAIGSYGGTWNRDDVIVFSGRAAGPLLRIPASGGATEEVTQLQPRQLSHRSPTFLPDGEHLLYFATGPSDVRGVYVGQLGRKDARRLFDSDSAAVYLAGHLLFVRQGTLYAQRFNPVRLTLSGSADVVAHDVSALGSIAACSVSETGAIAYRAGAAIGRPQLAWISRSGEVLARLGEPAVATSLALAPDGRWAAVSRSVEGNPDIFLVDTARAGLPIRLTSSPVIETSPVWSPDGARLVFQSHETEPGVLYEMPASGNTAPTLLLAGPFSMFPTDWSSDGRTILFQTFDPKTRWDIWALPMHGDRTPTAVVRSDFDEREAMFSPDGKWIAYSSDESGRAEVYVQPFPGPGRKIPVSIAGGSQAYWRRDGKELFYIAADNRLMSVPIRFVPERNSIEPGAPMPLFVAHLFGTAQGVLRRLYVASADGQRFLMLIAGVDPNASPITLILNWKAGR